MIKHRKQIRLKKYDYSQSGYYYVTICTQNRSCIFGRIVVGKMILNDAGNMINQLWLDIQKRFNNVKLDIYQIMPNHMHMIINIVITMMMGATTRIAPTIILGNIIGTFKSLTTYKYINGVKNNNWPPFNKRLWQRNYYEHIIRNETELFKIRQYVKSNPVLWNDDI